MKWRLPCGSLRMVKKLLTLLTLLALFTATQVLAVSLGDELILSRLGDPVEVEIELLQWEDLDLDRVQISVASQEEYEVFKLTWLPVLQDLRFNLIGPNLDGDVRVLVSSREPLNEPFLELLLVLRWPGGSLRREYVLLFDLPEPATAAVRTAVDAILAPEPAVVPPPAPATAPAERPAPEPVIPEPEPVVEPEVQVTIPVSEVEQPVVPEPVVASTPEPVIPAPTPPVVVVEVVTEEVIVEEVVEDVAVEAAVEEELPEPELPARIEDEAVPDARTQVAIEVETLSPQPPVELNTNRRTHQVRSGDSLWNIARQFRPAGAGENLYQMLLSMHNLNRSSFINGNISLLKANAVLQIPDADDINRIDALTAEAEFDRRWDEGTQRVDAVQRGEPIPLFTNNAETEELGVNEVEDERPLGTEAPAIDDGDDDLIMVSQTNALRPLQITDEGVADAGTADADPGDITLPALPEPAPLVVQIETTSTQQTSTGADEAALAPGAGLASSQAGVVVRQTIIQARAVITADLENELTAMRMRRETAEAIASQLNATLQQAQAEQAARDSLLGRDNLLLVASALLLFVALLTSVVFSLKVAGELRLRGMTLSDDTTLEQQTGASWLSGAADGRLPHAERKEPHLPEMGNEASDEMELVELQLPEEPGTTAVENQSSPPQTPVAGSSKAKDSGDLFARMDDLLAGVDEDSGKNT